MRKGCVQGGGGGLRSPQAECDVSGPTVAVSCPAHTRAQGQGRPASSRLEAAAGGYLALPSSFVGMVYSGSEPAVPVLGRLCLGWLFQESEDVPGVHLLAGQAHPKGPQEDR